MILVGLTGKRGVGKTELAKHLEIKYGYANIRRFAFADKLRNHCSNIWGESFANMPKEEPFKNYPWCPREFMVAYGNFIRNYDPIYWVNSLLSVLGGNGHYVIDDVRYPNEYKAIKEKGGVVVRIERHEVDNPYTGNNVSLGDSEDHCETFLCDYSITKDQNTTKESLYQRGDEIWKSILLNT